MLVPALNQNIAKYFPLANGKYQVTPGLFSLQHDFGNGEQDRLIFQLDRSFPRFRDNKVNARTENLDKYFFCKDFDKTSQRCLNKFLINSLSKEYPEIFSLEQTSQHQLFRCDHTNERFRISDDYQLVNSEQVPYKNLLDALMMQVQEDIAVITAQQIVSCLHLMAPNFWSAADKIGKSFTAIHQPVAGIEDITKNSTSIVTAMIQRGPYVRFAWGLTCDDELNHHPDNNNAGVHRREFNTTLPRLFLRVERQTINGLPEVNSAVFTIRSYLYNVTQLAKPEIRKLITAINSMTNKQLEYKGLTHSKSAMIEWLTTLS